MDDIYELKDRWVWKLTIFAWRDYCVKIPIRRKVKGSNDLPLNPPSLKCRYQSCFRNLGDKAQSSFHSNNVSTTGYSSIYRAGCWQSFHLCSIYASFSSKAISFYYIIISINHGAMSKTRDPQASLSRPQPSQFQIKLSFLHISFPP